MELDLVGAALARAGHAMKPRYVPLARTGFDLVQGKVDAVIADRHIFGWHAPPDDVRNMVDATQPLAFHAIFWPNAFRVGFRDRGLRDAFNQALSDLRLSGDCDRIVARHVER